MIDTLFIKNYNNTFKQYIESENNEKILNLKKVNIFVGENNSGKSRFMRELFLSFRYKEINNPEYYSCIDFPLISVNEINNETNKLFSSYLQLITDKTNFEKEKEFVNNFKAKIIPNLENNMLSFNKYALIFKDFSFTKDGAVDFVKKHNDSVIKFNKRREEKLKNITFSTYIPVLRSLKKIISNVEEPLTRRTEDEYFTRIAENSNIFNGENLYDFIDTLISSLEPESTKVHEFENFLSLFFNDTVKIEPIKILGKDKDGKSIENKSKDLFIKIGKEEQRSISSIGDGIQAIIILTFPLFLNKDKNHLLFIEEAELNLHPGFQRILLEIISSDKFPNTQVFITTHSNHFLDTAIENNSNIAIYSFQKKIDKNKTVRFEINEITKKAYTALDLLGVRSSSIFLSNCTIWVEGISERLYLRHYLKLYYKYKANDNIIIYKEDIHFSFVEYSGNNLTHWSFYENSDILHPNIDYRALSYNVLVIADKDEGKEDKHKNLEKRLGDSYYLLPCREIENLLSPDILQKTLLEYKYKRAINKEIKFKHFKYKDYENKSIGNFIYSLIKDLDIKQSILSQPNKYDNRVITNKSDFTKKAITQIKNWSDLSQNAKDLTERIYNFIKKNN